MSRIKTLSIFFSLFLVLSSALRLSAQREEPRRLLPVWFEDQYDGGAVVVRAGQKVLNPGALVEIGTILTIHAEAAARDYMLAALQVNDMQYVGDPVMGVTVCYRVSAPTTIKAIFTKVQITHFARIDIQQNSGGTLRVFAGGHELSAGDFVPMGTVLRVKAISAKSYWLDRLTAGRCSLINEPTDQLVDELYVVIDKYTLVKAHFAPKKVDSARVFPVWIRQYGQGGWVGVYNGSRELTSGDYVPAGTTITIKALSAESYWLKKLALGLPYEIQWIDLVTAPTDQLVIRHHTVNAPTTVMAVFSAQYEGIDYPQGVKNDVVFLSAEDVKAGAFTVATTGDVVRVEGAKANAPAMLYSADGQLIAQGMTDNNGTCELQRGASSATIYILRIDDTVNKISIK